MKVQQPLMVLILRYNTLLFTELCLHYRIVKPDVRYMVSNTHGPRTAFTV